MINDPATRANALADLKLGETVTVVSRRYHVSRKTLYEWLVGAEPTPKVQGVSQAMIVAEARQHVDLGELVYTLVEDNLQALARISRTISEPEYIRAQDASQMAQLVGVISDRTIRILAGYKPAGVVIEAEAHEVPV